MRWLLGLLLLLPIVLHGEGGTLEGAATKAFQLIQTLPGHAFWEYAGVIVIKGGVYYYSTVPVTDKKSDAVMIDIKTMSAGNRLVGIYHTHPCLEDYWTSLYSINDLIQQMYWKVPSFILDQCMMEVHEIDLAVDNSRESGRDVHTADGKRLIHLPAGRIVGHL